MPDIPNPFSPLDNLFITTKRHANASILTKPWANKLNPLKKFFGKKTEPTKSQAKSDTSPSKTGLENVPQLLGKTKRAPFKISWAINDEEIKEAQRLRYKVFAEEMGAHLPANEDGLDIDEFDAYCDHLLIRDPETLRVIGT